MPHPKLPFSPRFVYGTAWKEERTAALVTQAIACGFRAIDTANQRKHYVEAGVGDGIRAAVEAGICSRSDLWLQTKFTFRDGQDERLPYDPSAPIASQVQQSFALSCEHLGVTRLDSLILHGPSHHPGLGRADHEAWRAMEALVAAGSVATIGISNVNPQQLDELLAFATIAPTYVQNRCYASRGWDRSVRERCGTNGIIYQGFSLLTANQAVLQAQKVVALAKLRQCTPAQLVFAFAQALAILPLTGSSDAKHLRLDLDSLGLELSASEQHVVMSAV